MKQINVYSASELKEQFPDGFKFAHKKWENNCSSEIFGFATDDIMDSMKACIKALGITLTNWEISDSSPSWIKFTIPTFWSELADIDMLVDDYVGVKALKWIKSSLELKSVKRVSYIYDKKKHYRYDVIKSDGKDWSCEFTGVCYDHDFLESLLKDVSKNGCTISEAVHNLAHKAGRLFYQEWEDQITEEYFIDFADANEYLFTEKGRRI